MRTSSPAEQAEAGAMLRKSSSMPRRLPHPAADLGGSTPASTMRTTFFPTAELGRASAPREAEAAQGERRPLRTSLQGGPMSTPAQIGEGRGEAICRRLGIVSTFGGCRVGLPGFTNPKPASPVILPPGYLFASSSSSSSGSVPAITTSHSAVAAILPPGPESRVGGRR